MNNAALQTLDELNAHFAIPGVLQFFESNGLVTAGVTTPAASATLVLQGAHLTGWQPAGARPVLFLSERSEFKPGKAIRGGIPLIFPWFGDRSSAALPPPESASKSPSHGFARTAPWQLSFAALAGDDLHLSLTLTASDSTRALGYTGFRCAYQVVIGRKLLLRFAVANDGEAALRFEEAFHTYFAVSDVAAVAVSGLEGLDFMDKRDAMKQKRAPDSPLRLSQTTDRVYLASEGPCRISDPAWDRALHLQKANSRSTVVWNPWAELTSGLPDMAPEGWRGMLCVETANIGAEAVTLAPGEAHTMQAEITVDSVARGGIEA